jgi:hypothetical protein
VRLGLAVKADPARRLSPHNYVRKQLILHSTHKGIHCAYQASMKWSHVAGALIAIAALTGACTVPSDPLPVGPDSAIVFGKPSTVDDDAVVMVTDTGFQVCTGTLIAPNLVLTARHCVANFVRTPDTCGGEFLPARPAANFAIAVGANASPKNAIAIGKQIFIASGISVCSADVALILLDRELAGPDAKVARVRLDTTAVGASVYAVGYGYDASGKPSKGRQRRDGLQVRGIGPSNFTYKTQKGELLDFVIPKSLLAVGESTCVGDSGGPLFDKSGRIIAVTNNGELPCVDRPVFFGALHDHAALIRNAMAAAGHPYVK